MRPFDAAADGMDHGRTLLTARFTDAATARSAIEALQSAGIDGGDITLMSPFPEHSLRSTKNADGRMARYLARRVLLGALIGAAVGTLIGALAGAVLVATTSTTTAWAEVVALTIVGIIIGVPLGTYIGFERAGSLSDAWDTTFEDLEPGRTWIGVTVRDPAHQERARRALQRQHPLEIHEL